MPMRGSQAPKFIQYYYQQIAIALGVVRDPPVVDQQKARLIAIYRLYGIRFVQDASKVAPFHQS